MAALLQGSLWAIVSDASCLHVLVQVAFECEGLVALLADVGLDVRVRLDVGPQVGLVREGLAALRAREGLLAGVRPDVTLQQPRSAEALAAEVALAAQLVGSNARRKKTELIKLQIIENH